MRQETRACAEPPALLLCRALDAVEALRAQGYPVTVPEKTRSIVADEPMCELIAEDLGLRNGDGAESLRGDACKGGSGDLQVGEEVA